MAAPALAVQLQGAVGDAEPAGGVAQAAVGAADRLRDRDVARDVDDLAQPDAERDRAAQRDLELVLPAAVQAAGRTLGRRHVADRHRARPDVAQPDPRHELLEVAHVARVGARQQQLAHRLREGRRLAVLAPRGSARPGTGRPPRARAAPASGSAPPPGGRTGRTRNVPASQSAAEIAVGRAHEPEPGPLPAVAADPLVGPLLHDAQQLGLQRRRQLPDLVEQERPAVGQREGALARRDRARERPALVPEQLAARQRRHDRRAVHDDQILLPRPLVERVDELRRQLLAGPALAGDQHVDVAEVRRPRRCRAAPTATPRWTRRDAPARAPSRRARRRAPTAPAAATRSRRAAVPRDDVGGARVQQLPRRIAGQRLVGSSRSPARAAARRGSARARAPARASSASSKTIAPGPSPGGATGRSSGSVCSASASTIGRADDRSFVAAITHGARCARVRRPASVHQ